MVETGEEVQFAQVATRTNAGASVHPSESVSVSLLRSVSFAHRPLLRPNASVFLEWGFGKLTRERYQC